MVYTLGHVGFTRLEQWKAQGHGLKVLLKIAMRELQK